MKLARFSNSRVISYGVLKENRLICLPKLAKLTGKSFAKTITDLISKNTSETYIESLIQGSSTLVLNKATSHIKKIKLLAPVVRPPKIICLGLNYRDHAEEQGETPPDEPVIFMKPFTTIIGPEEKIVKPKFVKQLDYEAELAIIIGKETKNISLKDAKSCIFGYTILNDVSARDIQFRDKQWTRGKSFDTFAPTGPCITTTAQIKNPNNLRIRTWINKELRQNSCTCNMVLNVSEIIHHLSRVMTLTPCDIIATGTPAGVGFAMKPEPKFLENSDLVEIEIENVGILRNRVVEKNYY